jgi:hypothetical protein
LTQVFFNAEVAKAFEKLMAAQRVENSSGSSMLVPKVSAPANGPDFRLLSVGSDDHFGGTESDRASPLDSGSVLARAAM